MHHLLKKTSHRPYQVNDRSPWVMKQTWSELAFLHWRVDVQSLRAVIPDRFEIDTFDGSAWIGVVPFAMSVAVRSFPVEVMKFLELNVRTYVTYKGKAGVYFLSLDASSPLAVFGACSFFHLPYYNASMKLTKEGQWCHYKSARQDSRAPEASFIGSYRPVGDPFLAEVNSLEYFLTERYCLFVEHADKAYCCDIHHDSWRLQMAETRVFSNTMVHIPGVNVCQQDPHALYVSSIETLEWLIEQS